MRWLARVAVPYFGAFYLYKSAVYTAEPTIRASVPSRKRLIWRVPWLFRAKKFPA